LEELVCGGERGVVMWGLYTRACYGVFDDSGGSGGVGFAPLYYSKVIDVWARRYIRHLASLSLKYIHTYKMFETPKDAQQP